MKLRQKVLFLQDVPNYFQNGITRQFEKFFVTIGFCVKLKKIAVLRGEICFF
jgi:hypothetical protein